MFSNINWSQTIMGLLAVILCGGVVVMYAGGQTPPDTLLGFFGVVLGFYFKRGAEDDAITSSERVLRAQVLAE